MCILGNCSFTKLLIKSSNKTSVLNKNAKLSNSPLSLNVTEFANSVRKHWSIENQLHWCLDVIFKEDSAHARKDNSPLNMNILRKTALSLLNQAKYGRLSKNKMRFKAALDPEALLNILLAHGK